MSGVAATIGMSPEAAQAAAIIFGVLAAVFAYLVWRARRRRKSGSQTADLHWPIEPPTATDADIAALVEELRAAELAGSGVAAAGIAERLAALLIARGAPDEALDSLRPYRVPLESARQWVPLARLLLVAGAAHAALGRMREAQGEMRRAARLFERARADKGAATAHHALGDLMHHDGDMPGAAEQYALAAGRYKRAGNREAADRLFAATRALEELTAARYSPGNATPEREKRGGPTA